MKLISLIGNDPLKVLLPLTQLTNLIDGAYFLVTEANLPMAKRLLDYLVQTDHDEEGPRWDQSISIIVFSKQTSYSEICSTIREITDREFSHNEEVAFNKDGGNILMKRAAGFSSRIVLAPLLHVDTRRSQMWLSYLSWDHKSIVNDELPCTPMQLPL